MDRESADEKPALNGGALHEARVRPEEGGSTLLAYLSRRFRHASAEEWQAHVEAGLVTVGGLGGETTALLRAGDWVAWHRPPWVEPDAPLSFGRIFEDEELLVVDKPSGLPTLPGGGFQDHTLLALVRAEDPAWAPMHRLGRGTSGLVLFARGESMAALQRGFRDHSLEKRYLGLSTGQAAAPRHIAVPIGRVPHPRLGLVHAALQSGKASETWLERSSPRGADSLVELRLVTGRPHQIRIHLAAIGHPLVGDLLYGVGGLPVETAPALPGDLGYALHAWRLAFTHPRSGLALRLEAPPPPALR